MKGTSRRIIVVDSPEPELFEQVVFIIRKDIANQLGVTQEQLIQEACQVARNYCRSHKRRKPFLFTRTPLFWSALGAGSVALGWLVSTLTNV